jgi:hypothetical protein
VDHDTFREGYTAGWRSIRGDEPILVPACPVIEGVSMYLIGFSRGVRDAKLVELPDRRSPSGAPR